MSMKTKSKPGRQPKKSATAVRSPRGIERRKQGLGFPLLIPRGETTPVPPANGLFPVIAMAASVGGLPADFPAAIAIVMHLAPDHKSILAEILSSRTHLEVKQAHTGDMLCQSSVFVAPPNHHLFVAKGGGLRLSSSAAEKVHYARPSAEPLFASVADIYQKNAIAVVLTGGDGDGSFGVQIIKEKGGKVIAQDRPTSQDFSMPETSIKTGDVDFILPLNEIAPKLIQLVGAGASPNRGDAKTPPSPPSDVGEGRGEEVRLLDGPSPRSSPHSFLAGRGRRKATHRPAKLVTPHYAAGTKDAMIERGK